ncbi:MAG: class I SAM-dependent methyltransferase [Terriglobia bacterium]
MGRAVSLFSATREPEPEVMETEGEAEAYSSAAAQAHLDALDSSFASQVVSLGVETGLALDAGTGPGSIPLKIAQRCPRLHLVGVDRSPAMLHIARSHAAEEGLDGRVEFLLADASRLCFPDAIFDLVISNSLLHHLNDPVGAFNELARVTRPEGKVLVRDLRRPPRLTLAAHVAWHGRHYHGRMKQLYEDSVRAAYMPREIQMLIRKSRMSTATVMPSHRTHVAIVWEKASGNLRTA